MARALWRRHRVIDSPRPAGRRWAGRLRQSGSLARQVLSVGRIRRRPRETGVGSTALLSPIDPQTTRFGVDTGETLDQRDPFGAPGRRLIRFGRVVGGRPGGQGSMARPHSSIPVPPVTGDDEPAALRIPLLPGEPTAARRLRFALVNGATLASLGLGMAAIFLVLNHRDPRIAATCLVFCVAFDGLDGALARRLGVASPFGAQMDSMADLCSFGIAAPVVVFAWLAGSVPAGALAPICGLVAACAAIRLARFNVSPKDGRFFCGVPTTMTAAVLALAVLIGPSIPPMVRLVGVAMLAVAMVTSFPYAKLARLLRLPPWMLAVPLVGFVVNHQVTFTAVVLAYLASGPMVWMYQRRDSVRPA